MAENLASLSIAALDDAEYLERLQDMLTICMEELSNPSEITLTRVEMLIELYVPHALCRLDNLQFALREIRNLVMQKEGA